MISELYDKYASLYYTIGNDRDFETQARIILELSINGMKESDSPMNVLELFAGPAYHCIAAGSIRQQSAINFWAIDYSENMRAIAVENGFKEPANYLVGTLPDALSELPGNLKFDMVFCLRYSLGYLKRAEVHSLFSKLSLKLNAGARIFIELHDVSQIIKNFSGAEIHTREKTNSRKEVIKCIWPSGDIDWDSLDYVANMEVVFEIKSGPKEERLKFLSRENIFCANEIIFIASLSGFTGKIIDEYADPSLKNVFNNSILIELIYEQSL